MALGSLQVLVFDGLVLEKLLSARTRKTKQIGGWFLPAPWVLWSRFLPTIAGAGLGLVWLAHCHELITLGSSRGNVFSPLPIVLTKSVLGLFFLEESLAQIHNGPMTIPVLPLSHLARGRNHWKVSALFKPDRSSSASQSLPLWMKGRLFEGTCEKRVYSDARIHCTPHGLN